MEIIIKYYGIDWMAMLMTFCSLYLLGKKNKYGFIFGLLANFFWLCFGILVLSAGNILANVVFSILNIKGYLNWKSGKI